jgi:predicted kinase
MEEWPFPRRKDKCEACYKKYIHSGMEEWYLGRLITSRLGFESRSRNKQTENRPRAVSVYTERMPESLGDAPRGVLDQVAIEYERTIEVPGHIPSAQWMLMPVGLIGSGKTSVLRPLSTHFGLVRISTDEIRERLRAHGHSYAGCREIATALGKKYLDRGYSVAFDANNGSPTGLERMRRVHETFPDVPQIFINIDPPDEFIIEKLKHYRHTWLFENGEAAIAAFRKNKASFILPDLPFIYRFDTSRALEPQVQECIERIEGFLATML